LCKACELNDVAQALFASQQDPLSAKGFASPARYPFDRRLKVAPRLDGALKTSFVFLPSLLPSPATKQTKRIVESRGREILLIEQFLVRGARFGVRSQLFEKRSSIKYGDAESRLHTCCLAIAIQRLLE